MNHSEPYTVVSLTRQFNFLEEEALTEYLPTYLRSNLRASVEVVVRSALLFRTPCSMNHYACFCNSCEGSTADAGTLCGSGKPSFNCRHLRRAISCSSCHTKARIQMQTVITTIIVLDYIVFVTTIFILHT